MELELLKDIWKKTGEGYYISEGDMQKLIHKKSSTAAAQIIRGVRNKTFIAGTLGLLMLGFSVFLFNTDEVFFDFISRIEESGGNLFAGVFYMVFGIVLCFISATNALSYKKIKKIEKHSLNLRSSIEGVLKIIRQAMWLKILSDTLVVPVTVLLIIIISLVQNPGSGGSLMIIVYAVLGAMAFGVFSFFVTKWGQKKRYGSQIEELENCLQELVE